METPSGGVSITIASSPACNPCTIWSATTVPPAPLDDADPASIELGTKFRSDADGFVTGVRFYKIAANTGIHTGTLWTQHRHAARDRHVHERNRVGLAAAELRQPGRDHGEHGLCRLVPRAERPLHRLGQFLRVDRRRQPAAPRAEERDQRRERPVSLRRRHGVPEQHLPVGELLGRRRLHHHAGGRYDAADRGVQGCRLPAPSTSTRWRRCRRPSTKRCPRRASRRAASSCARRRAASSARR